MAKYKTLTISTRISIFITKKRNLQNLGYEHARILHAHNLTHNLHCQGVFTKLYYINVYDKLAP